MKMTQGHSMVSGDLGTCFYWVLSSFIQTREMKRRVCSYIYVLKELYILQASFNHRNYLDTCVMHLYLDSTCFAWPLQAQKSEKFSRYSVGISTYNWCLFLYMIEAKVLDCYQIVCSVLWLKTSTLCILLWILPVILQSTRSRGKLNEKLLCWI